MITAYKENATEATQPRMMTSIDLQNPAGGGGEGEGVGTAPTLGSTTINDAASQNPFVHSMPGMDLEKQQQLLARRPLAPKPLPRILQSIPTSIRLHYIAMASEFVGTFMFLLFAYVIAQNANSDTSLKSMNGPTASQTLVISCGFGFSVMCSVFTFFRVSGGHLNPSVTITLFLTGNVPIVRAVLLVVTQLVAGICAAAVADALTPGPILFANELAPGVNRAQGLFVETFTIAMLCMVVMFMAVEKHRATNMAPFAIGIALLVGHLLAVPITGAGINPARNMGPNVANRLFHSYDWIYYVSGILAPLLVAALWWMFKFLHYEECNPGQDADRED